MQHLMPKPEEPVKEKEIEAGLGLKATIYDEDFDKVEKLTFDMETGQTKEVDSDGQEIKFHGSSISDSASEPDDVEDGCKI